MLQRWSKLERDFRQKSGRYDISKIPDIYDCVKYDVQHNGSLGLQGTAELLRLSKALADVVIPQVCLMTAKFCPHLCVCHQPIAQCVAINTPRMSSQPLLAYGTLSKLHSLV